MTPLVTIFRFLCSPQNVWTPGGVPLCICQRCTGLYVGAAAAGILYACFRPRPTPLVLWTHGMFLLLMVPYGYHWLPQNGAVRTLSGQCSSPPGWFCYFSLLLLRLKRRGAELAGRPAAGLLPGPGREPAGAQAAVHWGGRSVAVGLEWTAGCGLLLLAVLGTANLVLLPPAIWRAVRPGVPPPPS